MQKHEADRLLMALDGVMAYLETIRGLVQSSIDIEPFEPPVEALSNLGANDDPELCGHPAAVEVLTLGETNMVCHACGKVWAC